MLLRNSICPAGHKDNKAIQFMTIVPSNHSKEIKMKASELIKELCEGAFAPEVTCDTIKAGDAEKEIKRVGVTMFATVDVVRRAKEMGVDMLIVHEPTYYDHMDTDIPKTAVTVAKKQLIEESGIVIWRYHDNMHYRIADMITEGEMHYLGIKGENDAEKVENLIKALDELKARVGMKSTIRDYVPDEADFLARLDDMVEQAFDDQCTGANPRYPLMSEIKQMYLNAYYGKHETV